MNLPSQQPEHPTPESRELHQDIIDREILLVRVSLVVIDRSVRARPRFGSVLFFLVSRHCSSHTSSFSLARLVSLATRHARERYSSTDSTACLEHYSKRAIRHSLPEPSTTTMATTAKESNQVGTHHTTDITSLPTHNTIDTLTRLLLSQGLFFLLLSVSSSAHLDRS